MLSFHRVGVPNLGLKSKNSEDESQYNSLKSNSSLAMKTESTVSSVGSNESCGLKQSLKKFFNQNQLSNVDVRQEMMKRVSYSSAKMNREHDSVYENTISVVNSVRHLLKGIEQYNTAEYIDLVKVKLIALIHSFIHAHSSRAWDKNYETWWPVWMFCSIHCRTTHTGVWMLPRRSWAPTWMLWWSRWRRL